MDLRHCRRLGENISWLHFGFCSNSWGMNAAPPSMVDPNLKEQKKTQSVASVFYGCRKQLLQKNRKEKLPAKNAKKKCVHITSVSEEKLEVFLPQEANLLTNQNIWADAWTNLANSAKRRCMWACTTGLNSVNRCCEGTAGGAQTSPVITASLFSRGLRVPDRRKHLRRPTKSRQKQKPPTQIAS